MGTKIDLTGKRYGRLLVIRELPRNKNKKIIWLCTCDCGKAVEVIGGELSNGNTKSCGCLKVDKATKHAKSRTKEYRVWADMIQRCTNPKSSNYPAYGGKGISVCDEWKNSFERFLEYMGERPSSMHSIDRINVHKNYEPGNCRWATREVQDSNKTTNVYLSIGADKRTLTEWAKLFGIHPMTLKDYLKRHSFEEAYLRYSA